MMEDIVDDDDADGLANLVATLATVVKMYLEEHPDTKVDRVAAAISYFQGTTFRLASEVPASKLN